MKLPTTVASFAHASFLVALAFAMAQLEDGSSVNPGDDVFPAESCVSGRPPSNICSGKKLRKQQSWPHWYTDVQPCLLSWACIAHVRNGETC